MDDKERKRQMALIYRDSVAWANSIKRQQTAIDWEKRMLTAYKRLRLIQERMPDGKIVMEGDDAPEFYGALLELFGSIESRITELGLQ